MGRFRQFLAEAIAPGTRGTGIFGLPDLQNMHMPGQAPVGGHPDLKSFVLGQREKSAYADRDTYELTKTLNALQSLAENIASAYQSRMTTGQIQPVYKNVTVQGQMIHGIEEKDITGGGYPRLKPEEKARGEKLMIIIPDVQATGFLAMDITVLKTQMEALRNKIHGRERGTQAMGVMAGGVDKAWDTATSGGMVPVSKGTNPLKGQSG